MSSQNTIRHIAILGAGAIGCYVGATWSNILATSGIKLTMIGRASVLGFGGATSLRICGSSNMVVPCDRFERSDNIANLEDADIIFVVTKATAIENVVKDLRDNAHRKATIVSLMNGLEPVRRLRSALPEHQVLAGMVPFNVVWRGADHLQQSSAGTLSLENADITQTVANHVKGCLTPIDLYDDLQPVQYGKLLLNLINPINALSGLPLYDMLSQKAYREIYAATVKEALSVYQENEIEWQKVGPISPKIAVHLLQSPDVIFNNTLLKLQKIDRSSMTSMGSDLQNRKPTEISIINEEIVRLAARANVSAPINTKLTNLIREAEQSEAKKAFSPSDLATALDLE